MSINSVFMALVNNECTDGKKRIAFVRRKDSMGSLYLPGGRVEKNQLPSNALNEWRVNQLGFLFWSKSAQQKVWLLSDGSPVGLHIQSESAHMKSRLVEGNSLISEITMLTSDEIGLALYKDRVMPWAQAKMAIWAMYRSYSLHSLDSGPYLKTNLGYANGVNWVRPPD